MGKFGGSESKIVANSRKSSDMRAFAVDQEEDVEVGHVVPGVDGDDEFWRSCGVSVG